MGAVVDFLMPAILHSPAEIARSRAEHQQKYRFDVCVFVHHIWNWREIPTWCNNLFIII